jgi:hypothetical protein
MNGTSVTPFAVSANGQAVLFDALNAFSGPSAGAGNGQVPYEAQRTTAGWQTSELAPPQAQYRVGAVDAVTSDFRISLIVLGEPFDETLTKATRRCFLQESNASTAAPVSETDTTPQNGHSYCNLDNAEPIGSSSDLSHIFIDNALQQQLTSQAYELALVPGSPVGKEAEGPLPSLVEDYETEAGTWHYRLVGVDGPNNPDGSGSVISDCGTALGDAGIFASKHTAFHAISSDGSTVFFTAVHAVPPKLCSGPSVNELFARVDGSQTVPISEPSTGYCPASNPNPVCAGAQFEGASADGSKVFFTTTQPEVPGVADSTTNLYEATLASSGGVTRVASMVQISAGDTSGAGAQVQGVVRVSDDGSHVYFVAQGMLSGAPNSQGQSARVGADNLYVYHGGTISFIGDLCSGANESGAVADGSCGGNLGFLFGPYDKSLWAQDSNREAVAAPYGSTTSDGRFFVFASYAQLTPDDTDDAKDVYRYDSQTGSLVRISAGANGYGSNGNNNSFDATIAAPNYNTGFADAEVLNPRPVSNDGSFVFFSTSEPLQSDDVDGAPDVYEWHCASQCSGPAAQGAVAMISDGQNPSFAPGITTTFAGSSESGGDVFFTTPDVLVPGGGANISNMYDARIGGGFPVAAVASPCSEDACQGPLSAAATPPSVATATYAGGANLAPPASKPAVKVKPLTRAQQLAKARKACKKEAKGKKRARCEASARKRYGAKPNPKVASRRSSR